MDALLILNNKNVSNCRVLVQVKQRKLKEEIISLLEKDQGEKSF